MWDRQDVGVKCTARILPFIALSIPSQDDRNQTTELHTESKCLFTTSQLCLKAPGALKETLHKEKGGTARQGTANVLNRPGRPRAPSWPCTAQAEAGALAGGGSVRPARVRLDQAPGPRVQTWEGW